MGIVPNDSRDTNPTHYALYGHGGYRCVEAIGDLQTIPVERLEEGCMCYVTEQRIEYRWVGGRWVVAPRCEQTDYNDLLDRIEQLEKQGNVDAHKEIFYNNKSEWLCEHNLGKKPSVTILDEGGDVVMADIRHLSDNLLVVTFGMNVTGKLILN